MIPESRKNEILELLKLKGYCRVEELAKHVFVSVPTMRRDLTELEKDGYLKRIHGGATYVEGGNRVLPFEVRNKALSKERAWIGEEASKLIKNQDTVFIDTATSCLYLAKAIPSTSDFKVCTNSFVIAQTLAQIEKVDVEFVCGIYEAKSASVFGHDAVECIKKRHARICFFSCGGVDSEFGLSNITGTDVSVKKEFARNADVVVLLADHTKMDRKCYYHVMDLKGIDILVTDQPLSLKLQEACQKENIQVIVANRKE